MSIIKNLLAAAYPCICITSQEPERVAKAIQIEGWDFYEWDCNIGIMKGREQTSEDQNPVAALSWLNGRKDTVLVARNLHLFIDMPELIQAIETGSSIWKAYGSALVMLCPSFPSRPEIDKLFHVIDYPLPSVQELYQMQCELVKGLELTDSDGNLLPTPEPSMEVARAARGLTEFEAETAFARCLSEKGRFDIKIINDVKGQMIKKTGFMEYWEPESMDDVGGLGEFKDWLRVVEPAFKDPESNLPQPKGVLQVGVAGGGKSLSSKATASFLNRPLIRLDVNAVKSSGVGDSEKNLRTVARTLEAFGECVCWMDELDKMFAGGASTASAASDAGTSVAMFGFWLTFMQETKAPILFMATANDVSGLPSAFLRRFDELFFVDLPTTLERAEIIQIMNRKYGSELPESFADLLAGYTGAEIEKVAKASLFHGPEKAAKRVTPISRMNKEEIDGIRNWAKAKGAQLANTPEEESGTLRKIRRGE